MMLFQWFFFALAIVRVEGLDKIWKLKDISANEKTMITILEYCFGNHSSFNPVIIFGDVHGISDKVSVLRFENYPNGPNPEYRSRDSKPSSIVLMEESLTTLTSNLESLNKTKLWNHMIPFFIISQNATCENAENVLMTMWAKEIVSSIYICAQSINDSPVLYTLNPIANYAPHPWKRIEQFSDLNIFHLNFDTNISCTDLIYDKTRILNGYPITASLWRVPDGNWKLGKNYYESLVEDPDLSLKCLRSIITALNASGRVEIEFNLDLIKAYCKRGTDDITLYPRTLYGNRACLSLFPHRTGEMIAVVKLKPEVSTLQKILRLWSTPVLLLAAVVFIILFLVFIMKNWNFGLALLDITRLLIYSSIQTDSRHHSFRIYFTTMLIFMIISNGVFQGKIAAFLTTREKGEAVESIHELKKLGYEMYAPIGTSSFARAHGRAYEFKEVKTRECIDLVLTRSNRVCAINKQLYETYYILLDLDHSGEILNAEFEAFYTRKNWPLYDRVNNMMMRLVESGLPDFWWMKDTIVPKGKRQAMEDERASPQYRPVVLIKLTFAFQFLVLGLFVSTIVLFSELWWARLHNS